MEKAGHTWTFARIGGIDQVVLKNGGDIAHLSELDPKLWAILSAPARQAKYADTYAFLDSDHDGKVRIPDILGTIAWLENTLVSLDVLFEKKDGLTEKEIADGTLIKAFKEACEILKTQGMLSESGQSLILNAGLSAEAIALQKNQKFNGDGVVIKKSTDESAIASFIDTLVGLGYTAQDASGEMGLDKANLDAFLADAAAMLSWRAKMTENPELMVCGDKTDAAVELFTAIKPAVDDFFKRCQIFALSTSDTAFRDIDTAISMVLAGNQTEQEKTPLPLALPNRDVVLHLDKPMLPAFMKTVSEFFAMLPSSLAEGKKIDFAAWQEISRRISAYAAWKSANPAPRLNSAEDALLAEYLKPMYQNTVSALLEQDLARAEYAQSLDDLRKLIILKRDFLGVLQNFVNLDAFYRDKNAVFQSGRLYIDGRELELCMDVVNPGAHGTMAIMSSMYLLYCDLVSKEGKKKSIVAALTGGDADNIFAGRNGVFIDNEGKDWDAVIAKVVVQPISIREAFFSPYKWVVRTLEEAAARRAANAESANLAKLKTGTEQAVAAVGKADAKPDTINLAKKIDVGTVAAIGVALGSIGAMVTGLLGIFVGMGVWMPLGIIGVLLLISGPSMILAYMKLRKRNIGPLLNAEGWAVNGKLKINVPFGGSLTHLGAIPLGSARLLMDPFEKKKKPWLLYLLIVLAIVLVAAYFLGWLDSILAALSIKK